MAADPKKTVTVAVDVNGNVVVMVTHDAAYTEKPTVKVHSIDESEAKIMNASRRRHDTETHLSLAAPLPPGTYEVTVTCSGTDFVTTITVPAPVQIHLAAPKK